MIDLNKLAAEIHEAAVAKGFWDVEDAEEKHLAKMISELGEVVQADRAGVMYEIEHEGAKPEGVVAELADFVMMAIDFAMQRDAVHSVEYGIKSSEEDIKYAVKERKDVKNIADLKKIYASVPVIRLVISSSGCVFKASGYDDPLGVEEVYFADLGCMINMIYIWCAERDYDLWDVIRQKMAYNESRPALHGRKY